METLFHKRSARVFLLLVKYLPAITAFLLMAHTGLTIIGINEYIIDNLAGVTLTRALFMWMASYAFNFCYVHRLFTGFNFLISTAMTYNEEIGFVHLLIFHEAFFLIAGTLLFIWLFLHLKCFHKRGSAWIFKNRATWN